MDPAPSDGILPGSAREGLTERPPATPRPASPNDVSPVPKVAAGQALDRVLIFASLVLVHAAASVPAAPVGYSLHMAGWDPAGIALWAFFFPAFLLNWPGSGFSQLGPLGALSVNSVLWAACVYGLFLVGRCAWRGRTRLTRPSGFG